MNPAGWITFLGIVITGVVSLFGAISSARATRKAAERTAELTQLNLEIESRDAQVISWRQDAETLRIQRDEGSAKIISLERRISMFVRWGRKVIVWYETIDSTEITAPLPRIPDMLELNGDTQ